MPRKKLTTSEKANRLVKIIPKLLEAPHGEELVNNLFDTMNMTLHSSSMTHISTSDPLSKHRTKLANDFHAFSDAIHYSSTGRRSYTIHGITGIAVTAIRGLYELQRDYADVIKAKNEKALQRHAQSNDGRKYFPNDEYRALTEGMSYFIPLWEQLLNNSIFNNQEPLELIEIDEARQTSLLNQHMDILDTVEIILDGAELESLDAIKSGLADVVKEITKEVIKPKTRFWTFFESSRNSVLHSITYDINKLRKYCNKHSLYNYSKWCDALPEHSQNLIKAAESDSLEWDMLKT